MNDFIRTYADGTPYRPPRARRASAYPGGALPVLWLRQASVDWSVAWQRLSVELTRRGYRASSLRAHRQILRRFRQFLNGRGPAEVHTRDVTAFLYHETDKRTSWIHKGMIISVLRTFFDKLGGMAILCKRATPNRPARLPEVLSRDEVRALIAAAPTPRDQLLLSLMYGCGLKRGELQALQWRHFVTDGASLNAPGDGTLLPRLLPIPEAVQPLVRLALARCPAATPVFSGRKDKPLGGRAIAEVVRAAARAAGITRPTSGMILRHSYALHSLEDGMNLPTLQLALGHRQIKSTFLYERLRRPDTISPLDKLPGGAKDAGSTIQDSGSDRREAHPESRSLYPVSEGPTPLPPSRNSALQPALPSTNDSAVNHSAVSAVAPGVPPLDMAAVTLPFPPLSSLLDDVRRVYAGFKQALRSRFGRPPAD